MRIFGDRVQIMMKDKLPFSSSGLLARLRGAKSGKFLLSMVMLFGIPEMEGFVMDQDQQNSAASAEFLGPNWLGKIAELMV
jgi:hypothetical protein